MDAATYNLTELPSPVATGPLVIEAQFLSDRVMASSQTDRTEPEWPLHPSRLYSAAVNALHSIAEREAFAAGEAALRWMETLGPPDVHASEATEFPPLISFVPTNDEAILSKGKSAGLETCLPDSTRRRKGRRFPGVAVAVPIIRYSWTVDRDEMSRHRVGLQQVLSRIAYLGRSVNFVFIGLLEIQPGDLHMSERLEHWIPSASGVPMRTVGPGRLDRLRELHDRGMAADRGGYAFYRRADEVGDGDTAASGPWSGLWTAFALPGIRVDAAQTEAVAKAVRQAINHLGMDAALAAIDPALRGRAVMAIDPFISGHDADGAPARIDRLAVVPLANVLNEHADGRVLGFALLMPASATSDQWRMVSEIVYGQEAPILAPLSGIRLGQKDVEVRRAEHGRLRGFSAAHYVAEALTWSTVTPILLGRWPWKGRRKRPDAVAEAELVRAQVSKDCVAAGYPEPAAVEVSRVSHLPGVSDARTFTQHRAGPPRWATHATLTFAQPVQGPVLIGAGRFNGLGLLTPLSGGRAS